MGKAPTKVMSTPMLWHPQEAPSSMLHQHGNYLKFDQQISHQTSLKVSLQFRGKVG